MSREKRTTVLRIAAVLLCAALLLSVIFAGAISAFAGEELTFDIGINEGTVTATLSPDGVLTVSGVGETKDYTAGTAPFLSAADRITSVEIGSGIASLGDHLFYNCSNLKGTVTLPSGLVSLGDKVFSGDNFALAPRIDLVINKFTEATVVAQTPEENAGESPEAEQNTESSAPQEEEPSASSDIEEASSETSDSSETGEEASSSSQEESESISSEIQEETPSGTMSEPSETASESSEAEPESSASEDENSSLSSVSGELSAAYSYGVVGKLTAAVNGWVSARLLNAADAELSSVISEAESADSTENSESTENPDSTENLDNTENLENTEVSDAQETDSSQYTVEKITQQEIGEEIFFPAQAGSTAAFYVESAENLSFIDAMTSLGYGNAQSLVEAVFDCGNGTGDQSVMTLPLVNGEITLPQVPAGFSAPESEGIYAYTFGGWTESGDPAGYVRKAGSGYPVSGTDTPYFIAYWEKEPLIAISTALEDGKTLFSVPELEGWSITSYQWQICDISSEEYEEDNLSWQNIDGETESVYTRTPQEGDGSRLVRCVITLQRTEGVSLFSSAAQEQAELSPVPAAAEEDSSQTGGYSAPGRVFSPISSTGAVIAPDSAVTAYFVSDYSPASAAVENMHLTLYEIRSGSAAQTAFPSGTKITMGDLTVSGAYKYYSAQVSTASVGLSQFVLMGSDSVYYSGQDASLESVNEKLIFAVDLSASDTLPEGQYALVLSHSQGENTEEAALSSGAVFTVTQAAASSLSMEITPQESGVFDISLTPSVSSWDTAYSSGAGIRLYMRDASSNDVRFPASMTVSGGVQSISRESTGVLSFICPADSTTALTLDFSQTTAEEIPPGTYSVYAELWHAPGAESPVTGLSALYVTEATEITFEESAQAPERSILAVLAEGSSRILDVSESEGELAFTLQTVTEDTDRLKAVFYEKTGSTPQDESYTELDGVFSVIFETSGAAYVTVPQGTKSGTYRVIFSIIDSSNEEVARDIYNFIVK